MRDYTWHGQTPEHRFWAKVEKHDPDCPCCDGCWHWKGSDNGHGHGRFYVRRGVRMVAHRFAYETLVGKIPEGLTLDHLCRNRGCVNPDHLEAVSHAENCLRGEGLPARNARLTHCKRGHEFNEANTRTDKRGRRHCRLCKREREGRST